MSVTVAFTLLRENIMGCEKVMDWQMTLTGTYATGGFSVTPANVGLSTIDFVTIMPVGSSSADTVAIVAPILTTNLWTLWGSGSADDAPFDQVDNGTTVTGYTFVARCWGVA